MSERIWQECARIAAAGGAAAVATVVRRRGSLPMSAAAKMLITAGGARVGTVGGGCLEAEIVERAMDVIEKRAPALSKHSLNAQLAGDYGLTCGGTATVFVEPVFADENILRAYQGAVLSLARDEPAVVVTATTWDGPPRKAVVTAGQTGRAPAGVAAVARDHLRGEVPALHGGVVFEPLHTPPPLLVFGGGHVGGAIARAAAAAGWRVTVVDDREEFATAQRHPAAARAVCCDFHDVSSVLPLTHRTFAVVATRGHQHDALIVDQLARRELGYIGMLGSRRKVQLTWQLLESWGVPRQRLERIHAPVGLPIGADTPEEIAISVVAEMIAVRRGRPAALSSAASSSARSVRPLQPAV